MTDQAFAHDVLHERNGETIIRMCIDIALTFAVVGHIAYSVEIINLVAQLGFVKLRLPRINGMYFAWDSANLWPDIVPAEHKTAGYLTEADDENPNKWSFSVWGDVADLAPYTGLHEKFKVGEDNLSKLLQFIRKHPPGEFFLHSDVSFWTLTPKMAVLVALDFALRLGGHDNDVNYLLSKIYQSDEISNGISFFSHGSYNSYINNIGKSRRVWSLLKDGRIGKRLNDDQDIDAQFDKVKGVLTARVEKGIPVLSNFSLGQLLENLNANTISHDHDDDIYSYQPNELRSKIFVGNESIFHQPATSKEIQELEKRLGVELPEDYKDVLRYYNGLESVWHGYYYEDFFAPSHRVQWSQRRHDLEASSDWQFKHVPFELVEWSRLPFKIKYPPLDYSQAIHINNVPGTEAFTVLIKPDLTKKAVAAVFETLETVNDDDREIAQKVFASSFGSLEALKEMEWCVVDFDQDGEWIVYKSIRDFVEELVRASEFN